MNYRIIILLIFALLISCDKSLNKSTNTLEFDIKEKYSNSGFALINTNQLINIK